MKKRFLTFIACALCMVCACVALGSCGSDSKFKNWLNELLGKDGSTSSAPADSSTGDPDDSSSTDDGTSDDSTDSSTDEPDEPDDSSSSSTPDEPDEPIYNDFAYFSGEVLETLDSENVYMHHHKIVCTVGEKFRLRMDIVDGEVEEVVEIALSSEIATCDVRGNVTAISPGFANYAFKINEEYYSSTIIVAEKETAADFAYFDGEGEYLLEDDIYVNPIEAGVSIGDTFRVKAVEANGKALTYKTYGEQEGINVDARGNVTAISAGEWKFSVEGATNSQLVTITVYGDEHVHTETSIADVSPTCTKAGSQGGVKCSDCGEIITEPTTVPATGHTEVTDAAVAAKCTSDGKTEGKHCSVCGEVLTAQTTIPATGHTEVTDAAVAATCTTDGKTAGKHCSVCGEVLTAQTTIPAPGHTEVTDAAVAATCTTDGKTAGKHCSVCGEVIVAQEVIPATGHFDKNADFLCDACGYAATANAAEIDVVDGELVAGNWYRIYRPSSDFVQFNLSNAPTVEEVDGAWPYTTNLTLMANAANGNWPGKGYVYGPGPMGYTLEGMYSVINDEYIDIYLEVGVYAIMLGNGTILSATAEITEESTISLGENGTYIKRLVDSSLITTNEVEPTVGECVANKTYRIYYMEGYELGGIYPYQPYFSISVTTSSGDTNTLWITPCGEKFSTVNQWGFVFEDSFGDNYRDVTFKAGTYTALDLNGNEVTFTIDETSVISNVYVTPTEYVGYVRRLEISVDSQNNN